MKGSNERDIDRFIAAVRELQRVILEELVRIFLRA